MGFWNKVMRFFIGEDTLGLRESIARRDSEVRRMYRDILDGLGDLRHHISRKYIYDKLRNETGLSVRTLQRILNKP